MVFPRKFAKVISHESLAHQKKMLSFSRLHLMACLAALLFLSAVLPAADLYHRRSEGDIVRQAVELNGISCIVKTAISLEAFNTCLKLGLSEAMGQRPGFLPLLHISAHGDSDGIQRFVRAGGIKPFIFAEIDIRALEKSFKEGESGYGWQRSTPSNGS